MAQYLSDIVEEEVLECTVCRKQFIVEGLTLDDWNFTWDGMLIDCCSDCADSSKYIYCLLSGFIGSSIPAFAKCCISL